ncbi:MAG: leucine-rich repeat protein [Clostridiales bacterium]|nr:leucine-rich repeat protein [Clostridiales bacterium]
MPDPKYVFISHSNKEPDASLLKRLSEYLESQRLSAWYDVDGLMGDKWTRQVGDRLLHATVYVLIASVNSLTSPEVKDELDKIRYEKVHNGKAIIPLVMDDSYFTLIRTDKDLYSVLGSNSDQAVLMSKFTSEQAAFERLGEYLKCYLDEFENNPKDFTTDESGTKLVKYVGTDSIVRIPASITEIGERAFSGNKQLQKVIVHSAVTKIERYAFKSCSSLVAVEGMQGVECCDVTAFKDSGVGDNSIICGVVFNGEVVGGVLTVPEGARVIASGAFNCCDAKQIVFPVGLEHIGAIAFSGSSYITEVEFPVSLKSIGKNAFADCMELKMAIFNGKKPADAELAFENKITIKELYK